jgi:hypothetical protein
MKAIAMLASSGASVWVYLTAFNRTAENSAAAPFRDASVRSVCHEHEDEMHDDVNYAE